MSRKFSIILFFLFVSVFVLQLDAQTPEQKKAIISKYNTLKLTELQTQYQTTYNKEKQEALKYAEEKNIPVSLILDDGGYAELMKIEKDGSPLYYRTWNVNASKSTRTNHLNSGGTLGLNLNGQNMTAHIWDGGLARSSHQEYDGSGGTNRYSIGDGTNTLHYHSAHVTGTIMASGFVANAKGMAPHAFGIGYEWNNDLAEATNAASNNAMLISNHSYGWNSQAVPDYYFGGYITDSRDWDNLMYNAPYYLMVVAAGNDGTTNYNGSPLDPNNPQYDKLTGHSTSKNNLVVANCQDVTVDANGNITATVLINSSSSQGPTDDLRIKPDITGNGTSVYSSVETADNAYNTLTGTSMASPNVAGSCLLLQQHYNNVNGSYMRSATLRGLVLHTADDAGIMGPDAIFGWGVMNSKRAAQVITQNGNQSIISELNLAQGQKYVIQVNSDGINALMASICWTDPAGTATTLLNSPNAKLINDLDIRITKNGNTWFPWRMTGVNTNVLGDNVKDNFERIGIAGATGTYTITITHKGNLSGGNQNYTLIITGISVIPDTEPPTAPTSLVASNITSSSVVLSWTASTDNVGVTGYDVYKDGLLWSSVTGTTATVTGLTPSTLYSFFVKAKDAAGNISASSNIVDVTTLPPDTQAPTAPTNLAASNVTQASLTLTWTASTDNVGVTAYDVFKDGSLWGSVTTTSANITGLTAGTQYSFYVKARDLAGNVSNPSNTVIVTTLSVTYCQSKGNSTSSEYIQKVVIGTINNTSNNNNGYGDYTNLSTTLTIGQSNTITITPWRANTSRKEGYRVWIDYNKDGDFADAGEQAVNINRTTASTVSGTFIVPSTALTGNTRMRVSMKYNASPTACEIFPNGEVEDYTVNISNTGGNSENSTGMNSDLNIYPNPVIHGKLEISYSGLAPTELRIVDASGRVVKSQTFTESLDISELSNGFYFIQVFTEESILTRKFIKQ